MWRGLLLVLVGTGIAALRGQLPGVEPQALYSALYRGPPESALSQGLLHVRLERCDHFRGSQPGGLDRGRLPGVWYLKQIYQYAYFPLYGAILALGAFGVLPRVRRSTKGEGTERRYFYGSVWAVTLSQTVLMALWKALPRSHSGDVVKLAVYVVSLVVAVLRGERAATEDEADRARGTDGGGLTRPAPSAPAGTS